MSLSYPVLEQKPSDDGNDVSFHQYPETDVCNPWPAGSKVAREQKFCVPWKGPDFQRLQFLKGIARVGLRYCGPKAEQILRQFDKF